MVHSQIPRLAPTVIRRPRLEAWFARHRDVAVRLLVAPPGSGKTTVLLSYLRHNGRPGAYCRLEPAMSADQVRGEIACVLGLEPDAASHHAIVAALAAAPCDLCVDQSGEPSPEGAAALVRLMRDLPEGAALTLALRSRAVIDVSEIVGSGLGVLCDFDRLAFTFAELRELAEACDVSCAHADVRRLWEATEGWAIAASGAVRKAGEDGRGLSEAFEYWCSRQGHLFSDYVLAALDRADEQDRELVLAMMAGAPCSDQQRLRALERQGLFVVFDGEGYRPCRALVSMRSSPAVHSARSAAVRDPLHVRLFGRFEATIGGRSVPWVRRRDQQIFKYLALKRDGTAPRAEILKIFWPNAERHLADQGLRTACSNVRKAIAQLVGYDRVEAYFRVGGEVLLDFENVVVDVQRFIMHANNGDEQFEQSDRRAAEAHYQAADGLNVGGLLVGDVPEPWFQAQAALLADRHALVLERLGEIAFERGDLSRTAQLAERALAMRPDDLALVRLLAKTGAVRRPPGTASILRAVSGRSPRAGALAAG
ncbi:MAG TPA: BTAD domain-containing putative transcriptional regulator [Candidatus Dormibacteraeota bacterium]|nr:BTAD domain-containing putative transcriptional regulator [Candidatus Dormibacteraeota bacterium]